VTAAGSGRPGVGPGGGSVSEPVAAPVPDSDPGPGPGAKSGRARRPARGALAALAASAAAGLAVGLWAYAQGHSEVALAAAAARAAVDGGRSFEAGPLIDRWAALAPGDGGPDYLRARLDVEADRPAEALDALRRASAAGYPEAPLFILRAVLQSRAGQFDAAEPVLAAAYAAGAEPRVGVAEGLARVYLKTFRLARTVPVLDAWARLAPADPRPWLWRVEVEERVSPEPAPAIRNYREALRRAPGRDDVRLGLAEKLRRASQPEEAAAEFDAVLAHDPGNVKAHVGSGRVALLKGDLAAADRHFEAALAGDPAEPVALREAGLIDLKFGRYARACGRLKAAVAAEPSDPEVRYSYARALTLSGDKARGAEENAVTERLRKEQEQITKLRQSLADRPDDLGLRFEVASWLFAHGHDAEALEWTRLILVQAPGHPPTCRLLADHYARAGNPGLANYYRLAAPPHEN